MIITYKPTTSWEPNHTVKATSGVSPPPSPGEHTSGEVGYHESAFYCIYLFPSFFLYFFFLPYPGIPVCVNRNQIEALRESSLRLRPPGFCSLPCIGWSVMCCRHMVSSSPSTRKPIIPSPPARSPGVILNHSETSLQMTARGEPNSIPPCVTGTEQEHMMH